MISPIVEKPILRTPSKQSIKPHITCWGFAGDIMFGITKPVGTCHAAMMDEVMTELKTRIRVGLA